MTIRNQNCTMSCENEHFHGHSHSHSHGDGEDHSHTAPIPTSEAQNLREYIDFFKLTALNIEQPNSQLQDVFKPTASKFTLDKHIDSDSDAQFVLNIPFTGNVKLYSLVLRTSGEAGACPKTIKLFKNKNNIDFDNASDVKPTHKIEHPNVGTLDSSGVDNTEDTFVEHHLPRALFQGTTHLTLFVEDNWSDDEDDTTRVYYIEVRGAFTSALSKEPVIALYEAAANPADHKNMVGQEVGNHANIN